MVKRLTIPASEEAIADLQVGDKITISGTIFCGRDAVLPKVCDLIKKNDLSSHNINLQGGLIFHTAVSKAGVGPTSSNKLEIESSIPMLSKAGVKVHLGKGKLKKETVEELDKNNSIYAIIAPVTALLEAKTIKRELLAFPELGMEALYKVEVEDYPAVVASAHGKAMFKI